MKIFDEYNVVANIKKYLEKKLGTKIVEKISYEDNGATLVYFWYKKENKFREIYENLETIYEILYGEPSINWNDEVQRSNAFDYNRQNKFAMFNLCNILENEAKDERWIDKEIKELLK